MPQIDISRKQPTLLPPPPHCVKPLRHHKPWSHPRIAVRRPHAYHSGAARGGGAQLCEDGSVEVVLWLSLVEISLEFRRHVHVKSRNHKPAGGGGGGEREGLGGEGGDALGGGPVDDVLREQEEVWVREDPPVPRHACEAEVREHRECDSCTALRE
eukprot:CAMPEP_0173383314 /NCGR_PEP_ID=MMETSP1356-20130122/5871_1 /TAXON_ID=77927 ORGANISM="Hemiselmis virescens, Strain PCC157" /NCGR_SAMPLE_ID=MMETSP1356 /ASSEMBLY_ACC=CAM_ASM_000847 /LENGTH=155 /DNA_ID=CAMNT_0014338109 /DNA_START=259 /DNA_END=726 /DNA_ORIENTATION=+